MNGTRDTSATMRADTGQPGGPSYQAPAPPRETYAPAEAWRRGSAAFDPRHKSPILACFLSAMPGLGQVYVGYYRQGFVHIVVFAATIASIASLEGSLPFTPLLALFLPFFWLYNIVDAGRRAAFYNQAQIGGEGIEIPQDLSLPGPGGSLLGGAVLIVVGAVLLSNTALDYSLAWVEDWWPVAPILFGVYLLWKGVKDRGQKA